MSKSPPTIAVTSTLAMVRTAATRGVGTDDVLAGAGLTMDVLEDPDARIPGTVVIGVWNALRERTGDPALQLAAPGSLPFGAYRVIDYLVGSSATVADGVRRFAGFFQLIADGVAMSIEHRNGEHALTLELADGRAVPPVYVDYVFAALVSRIRMRIKSDLRVLRVELRQQRPPTVVEAAYTEAFAAPVVFDAKADRLCFSQAEWESPMHSADPLLARVLEDHATLLAQRLPQTGAGFTSDVQNAIASVLPDGCSATQVARALHVSVRTLQRKLIASGTSFREVQDAVRGRLAQEYLKDRRVSIAEVACLLGFSDQSSFHRTFRRWTGESPGRWRRRHAQR